MRLWFPGSALHHFPAANRRVRGPAEIYAPLMPEAPDVRRLPPRLMEPFLVQASRLRSSVSSSFFSIHLSCSLPDGDVFSSPPGTSTWTAFNLERISQLSQLATLIPSWLTLRIQRLSGGVKLRQLVANSLGRTKNEEVGRGPGFLCELGSWPPPSPLV